MIGSVAGLWRYPVKSMLGESCEQLELDQRGVIGDRLFAVRDEKGKLGSSKDTRRFCKIDGLFAYAATLISEGDALVPAVSFPDGRRLRGDDSSIDDELTSQLGQPVTLSRETRTSHLDAGSIHIVTTRALNWLRAELPDADIDARRFRPNVLIDTGGSDMPERDWIGKILRIGTAVTLKITANTERCGMVAFAQHDLPHDPRILKYISNKAGLYFGVYAEVLVPGILRLGESALIVN